MQFKGNFEKTSKAFVDGFKHPHAAPYLLFFLMSLLCAGVASLITYFVFQYSDHRDKYLSESFTNQLSIANQQVRQFNENISNTNIALSQLKDQFNDFKSMQSELQSLIKDHEKRLMKIELKGNIR
jgi:septal ring factor EnvC (AmiA/AmiB activator)